MAERGIKGSVNVDSLSGLCYIQTDVLPNTELDKITWWILDQVVNGGMNISKLDNS